jgi:hypothetical protein
LIIFSSRFLLGFISGRLVISRYGGSARRPSERRKKPKNKEAKKSLGLEFAES